MNLLTRRFPTILGLILLILGAVGSWWYYSNNRPTISRDINPDKVRITNTADNKFSVSWITASPQKGWVEYGPVGEKISIVAYDDRDSSGSAAEYVTHHVTIKELQPETQYAFRIISGDSQSRFDKNGTPYTVTTGPTIATPPVAKSLYGEVGPGSTSGAIVYLSLPGAEPVSSLVTTSNNYAFTLSIVRTSDLQKYIEYDASATIANLTVESGSTETLITVTTSNSQPVPKITLGQNADFRSSQQPTVAQVEPQTQPSAEPEISTMPSPASESSSSTSPTPTTVTPGIFNIQPLPGINKVSTTEVTILNPQEDDEILATKRPEFRGTGPKDLKITITVESAKKYSGTVTVDEDGTWEWTPPADLTTGQHTITISYKDPAGSQQKITRPFVISEALANAGDPSFEATPSGNKSSLSSSSLTASSQPSVRPSSSPIVTSPSPDEWTDDTATESSINTAREIIPSTESGVPVTGVFTPTLLTGALGLVIMLLGALMLAL